MKLPSVPLDQVLSQLPVILIVTCSIVVDQSLRADFIEARLRSQILLWLCVVLSLQSLESEEHDEADFIFESWTHLVIVSNIVSVFWLASMGPPQRIAKGSKSTLWLSFGAWNATVSSSALFSDYERQSRAAFSVVVYIVSIAALWVLQWQLRRKERFDKEMRRIAISRNDVILSRNVAGRLDPSQWYTWRASTTIRWMSEIVRSQEESDMDVIQQLAPHHIDGALLDTLTIEQLLALDVPYGTACRMAHAIETELLRPYPKPREAQARSLIGDTVFTGRKAPLQSDSLTIFDQEYNNDLRTKLSTQKKGEQDAPSIPKEQEERMGAMMKERFGLELPRLNVDKTGDGPATESFSHPLMEDRKLQSTKSVPPSPPPITSVAAGSGIAALASVSEQQSSFEDIPAALLDQMPPQIKDAAKRRPDLVRQLLRNRSIQLQHPKQEDILRSVVSEEGEREEEDGDNDETTSLIQRKNRHSPYKSTGP